MLLKTIQMLGSSSGIVSHRLKPPGRGCSGFSLVSISTKSSPSSSSSSRSLTIDPSLLMLAFSARKGVSFGAFPVFCARSNSNPDGTSSIGNTSKINFCQLCGGPTKHGIPDGDEKMRAICTLCGEIASENPKMVVGCLIEHDDKILLCKRNIQPSHGLWTLPSGFLELGESAAEGAIRETWEEAGAEVQLLSPFAQLDIPLIGHTYMIFLARLKRSYFSPGPESSDCRLFSLTDIPFDSLAFSSMLVTINLYIEDRKFGGPKFHYAIINKRPGTSPSDLSGYTLERHLLG